MQGIRNSTAITVRNVPVWAHPVQLECDDRFLGGGLVIVPPALPRAPLSPSRRNSIANPKPIEVPRSRLVLISGLKPHPLNYRTHTAEQLDHLMNSLRENAFYQNVVISKDSYILAGHGITEAAGMLGMEKVSSVRVPFQHDSPAALKLLASDNFIERMADDDDRMLTDLLKTVSVEGDLLGTGFTDQSLAALLMVTRPASEIADFDAAAEWIGLPEFEHDPQESKLVLRFESDEDRTAMVEQLEIPLNMVRKGKDIWSSYWPPRGYDDVGSVKFE